MKEQHSEEIERRKCRLDDRLARDSWPEESGPVLAGGNEVFTVQRLPADGLLLIAVCGFLALKIPNILELTDYRRGGNWVGAAMGLLRPVVLGGLLFVSVMVLFGETSSSEFIYFNF